MDTVDLRGTNDNSDIGDIQELSPSEKAQITMTYWVLAIVTVLFILSGAAYIWSDGGLGDFLTDVRSLCQADAAERNHFSDFCQKYLTEVSKQGSMAAKEVFEFYKNFLPPIVTLVLGAHYVTKNKTDNEQ